MSSEDRILISYAGPDLMWAEWIREQLQRAGHFAELLEWTGAPVTDPVHILQQTAASFRHCIAVLSSSYIRAAIPTSEAGNATVAWAIEHPNALIPVLVRKCDLPAGFWQLAPVELREVTDERVATRRLLGRLADGRSQPPGSGSEPMTRFPGRRPTVWSMNMPPRNPHFTGRDDMLRELRQRVTTDVTALIPLQGLGGIGKTHLAVEYAYRFAADYDVVWWIPADKPSTARRALADLAVRLDLGGPQTDMGELIRAALDALRTGQPYQRWLLIFDNAGAPSSIASLVPGGPGHVLITSRDQTWGRNADALDVDVLSRSESIGFLMRTAKSLAPTDATRLADELDDMPLALEHAAAWLSTSGMALDDYLELLKRHANEALGTGHFAAYETSVAATWKISMNHLREASPAAAQLLELCAFIGPDPIPVTLLESAPADALPFGLHDTLRSPEALAEMLRAIQSYSLARVGQRPAQTLQQHRLVQAAVRSTVTRDQQAAYPVFAHQILVAAAPADPTSPANWPAYDALLPHVISSGAVTDHDPGVRTLVLNEAIMLNIRGEYQSALDISAAAIAAWSGVLVDHDHDLVLARREQGTALRSMNQFAEALAVQKASYDLALSHLGPDHPDTILSLSGLAANYRRLGNYAAARELAQHAVDVMARERGRDDPETLRHMHNLAVDYRLAGEFEAALEIDQYVAEALSRVLGPDALSTIWAVNNVARDLREVGQYYEALSLQEQTYARYLDVFGLEVPDTLRAMKNLAVSRRKAGRYEDAADLAENVLNRHRRKFGDEHPETLGAITNFACDQRCLGQLAAGRGYADQALSGFAVILGEDHGFTAGAAVNLAALVRLCGDPEEARRINERALEQLDRAFGPNHRYTLTCAVNLASDLAELGDLAGARELDERTLAALREVSGADHPYTLSCAINLALDLRALGERGAFRELFADTMERYERTLGAGHPETAAATARERAVCDFEPPPT